MAHQSCTYRLDSIAIYLYYIILFEYNITSCYYFIIYTDVNTDELKDEMHGKYTNIAIIIKLVSTYRNILNISLCIGSYQ